MVSLMLWEHQSGVRFPPSPPLASVADRTMQRVSTAPQGGSIPPTSTGCEAHVDEHLTFNQVVRGSNPLAPTITASDGTGIHTSLRNWVLGVQLSPRGPHIPALPDLGGRTLPRWCNSTGHLTKRRFEAFGGGHLGPIAELAYAAGPNPATMGVRIPLGPPWENGVAVAQGTPNPLVWVQLLLLLPFGSVSIEAIGSVCRTDTPAVNTGGSTPS